MILSRHQVFRSVTVELPKFLVMAMETMREVINHQREGEAPPMTLNEYLTWRLSEDVTENELRLMRDEVPGLRVAMEQYATWQAGEIREAAKRKRAEAAKQPTPLARFMKEHGIKRHAVWSQGTISRRRLGELMIGASISPTLRTMNDVTLIMRKLTGKRVEIADLFDLTVREP